MDRCIWSNPNRKWVGTHLNIVLGVVRFICCCCFDLTGSEDKMNFSFTSEAKLWHNHLLYVCEHNQTDSSFVQFSLFSSLHLPSCTDIRNQEFEKKINEIKKWKKSKSHCCWLKVIFFRSKFEIEFKVTFRSKLNSYSQGFWSKRIFWRSKSVLCYLSTILPVCFHRCPPNTFLLVN